ncbi:MAG: methyltransferase domain-containing protein [Chloroflexota bacterium]
MSQPPPICDYEGSTYRTDFWEGRGREYEDGAERVALRALLPPAGRRLVELGAGFGRLASLYAGYDEVVLLDYSRSQLEYARQRLGDERFIYVAADVYRLPLATRAVDTAVMVRVLHHLADAPAVFAQLARAVRPQGTLVLEFANKRHVKNIIRHLLGRGVNPFERAPYEFAALHYDFHPAWVTEQLQRAGWASEARRAVSLLRSALLKSIFPVPLLVHIDALLQTITAPWAPAPSIFLRARNTRVGAAEVVARGALFRCPACGHEPLAEGAEGLTCPGCGAAWPRQDGIYLFK